MSIRDQKEGKSTNDDSQTSGPFGLLVGVGFVLVLVFCFSIGRCTKEAEIRGDCDEVHRFVANGPPVVAYQCDQKK